MSESATSESLKLFCGLVVEKFSGYLNKCPTATDKTRVLELMERREFPGCFTSWDCKHYFWENCPVALAGQYKGKEGGKTMVMEAICDPFLYIWYFNFGHPGSSMISIYSTGVVSLGHSSQVTSTTRLHPTPSTVGAETGCIFSWMGYIHVGQSLSRLTITQPHRPKQSTLSGRSMLGRILNAALASSSKSLAF